jgi:hypothetical protein
MEGFGFCEGPNSCLFRIKLQDMTLTTLHCVTALTSDELRAVAARNYGIIGEIFLEVCCVLTACRACQLRVPLQIDEMRLHVAQALAILSNAMQDGISFKYIYLDDEAHYTA